MSNLIKKSLTVSTLRSLILINVTSKIGLYKMKNMLNRIFSYARFVNLLLTKNQTTRIFVDVFVVVTIPKKRRQHGLFSFLNWEENKMFF